MMSSLNREVEGYRAEAAAAGQALHHAVDRLTARLHGEEAALDRLRAETAAAAAGEAAVLGGLRGQVGELQGLLNVRRLGGRGGGGAAGWRHWVGVGA